MNSKKFKETLHHWKEMRKLTLDLLDVLPENKLIFSVGENMGSIGKQYRHIGDVQLSYNKGIEDGKVAFPDHYRRDYSIENSKEKLKEFLEEVDNQMMNLINENFDVKINWFGEELDLIQHLNALIEHEILHQGELLVYVRVLGIKFPKSWELWGL